MCAAIWTYPRSSGPTDKEQHPFSGGQVAVETNAADYATNSRSEAVELHDGEAMDEKTGIWGASH